MCAPSNTAPRDAAKPAPGATPCETAAPRRSCRRSAARPLHRPGPAPPPPLGRDARAPCARRQRPARLGPVVEIGGKPALEPRQPHLAGKRAGRPILHGPVAMAEARPHRTVAGQPRGDLIRPEGAPSDETHDARVGPHRHRVGQVIVTMGAQAKPGGPRSPARPRPPQKRPRAWRSRATWSSTALTKLGSFPLREEGRGRTSTYSLITTLGGAAPSISSGACRAEQRAQRRVDPIDRPFRHQRPVGHLVESSPASSPHPPASSRKAPDRPRPSPRPRRPRRNECGLELARNTVLQRLARGLHLEQRLHGIEAAPPSASAAFPRGWGPWVAARWGGLSFMRSRGLRCRPATWITSGRGLESDAALRLPRSARVNASSGATSAAAAPPPPPVFSRAASARSSACSRVSRP